MTVKKQTIYTLVERTFEGEWENDIETIRGVFSSQKKAQKYGDDFLPGRDSFYITEHVLDANSPLGWDQVYLLGWYDETGRSYLSSWSGDLPRVDVVVFGTTQDLIRMPLWNAPIPPGVTFKEIPDGVEDKVKYASEECGFYAFGWYMIDGVERKEWKP